MVELTAHSLRKKNKKYSHGFGPLLKGFKQIKFNDEKKLKLAINKKIAGIIIEPIQGEGGIRPANLSFLKLLRKICNESGILLFFDEVQCGFGRSGKLFSHEWAKIKPDIMSVAKGIGSGFPLGACMSTNKACVAMTKGSHGSTYGGNPLAMSVGLEVLKVVSNKTFLSKIDKKARYFWKNLKELENTSNIISEVRGAGFLLGIKTNISNIDFSEQLKKNKLLNVPAADNTVRLAPPLIVSYKEIDKSISIIKKSMKELSK
jgi:acetylornithine/N-succinyldiaminopimelate aminotransferase